MYNFTRLEATYLTNISIKFPDLTEKNYSSQVDVNIYRNNKDEFTITLKKKYQSLINALPPKNIMDKLMIELGSSMYPISLKVNCKNDIEVINFTDIAKRWNDKSKKLLERYPTKELKNYVEMALDNLKKDTFVKILFRDTFVPLFLANIDEALFEIHCHNFPIKGKTLSFHAQHQSRNNLLDNSKYYLLLPMYQYVDLNNAIGFLHYTLASEGDISAIYGEFEITTKKDESYVKQVSITLCEKPRRQVKTGWSIF